MSLVRHSREEAHDASYGLVHCLWCTGRFGFQKDMNALNSLGAGGSASADAENVTALLRSTNEVEHRVQVVTSPEQVLVSCHDAGTCPGDLPL